MSPSLALSCLSEQGGVRPLRPGGSDINLFRYCESIVDFDPQISVAYTQRYFGTDPWPDDGRNFSIATDADDLAKFIKSLNAGPVHLVTRA